MDISRITKAVAELRRDNRFEDAERIREVDIDVLLPDDLSETNRQMAQTVTALALRCFTGKIRIHCSASDSLLRVGLEAEARKRGTPQRLDFAPQKMGPWLLAVGRKREGAICADASGWTARINGVFKKRIPAAVPAVAFAAACAVAKLFNQAIFRVEKNAFESWDFCLLRFLTGVQTPVPVLAHLDLGTIGLLGAGAIGSAVGYVLRLSTWSGRLDVIDSQYFEGPNLETCISADIQDVNRPLHKAAALVKLFETHGITATERQCKVVAGERLLEEQWDAFICAVDNTETRRILDATNSRILINAGLGATKHDAGWVLWTWHGKSDPALSSIYREVPGDNLVAAGEVPEEFREECSRKHYNGVSLALPFVGLAAGSLLTANLYQNATGLKAGCASLHIDLFGKQQRMTVR